MRDVLEAVNQQRLQSVTSPQLDLLVEIAAAYWQGGDATKSGEMYELALKAAAAIKDPQEHYDALLLIATSQAEVGRVGAAVRTSRLAPSPRQRASILHLVAGDLSSTGHSREAMTIARQIPDECQEERSIAICLIASGMAEKGEPSEALGALQEVKVDLAHAWQLQLRQKAGASLAAADAAIVHEAAWKASGLLNVVEAHARAGQFDEATKLAETIRFGCFRDRALRNTASIAANAGNLEVARRLTSQIQDDEEKSLALGDVAVGEATKGLLGDSLKTAETISQRGDKAEAMMRIALVLAQSGNHAEAKKMFLASERGQIEPAVRMAREVQLAQAFAAHHEFASVEQIAGAITDQAAQARIMAAIGAAHKKANNSADGQKSFQTAYECALRVDDRYAKTQVLCEIAASEMAAGDAPAARRLLKGAAQTAATIPVGGGTNVMALQEVAIAQRRSGDHSGATATFQVAMNAAAAYLDQEYIAKLCQGVTKAQTECGDGEAALACANRLEPGLIKCRALLGIAQGLLREPQKATNPAD